MPDRVHAFHLARRARERFAFDGLPASTRGDLAVTDLGAIRRLAARMNAARPPAEPPAQPGQIAALAVLHELGHLVIDSRGAAPGDALEAALAALRSHLGDAADRLLERFARDFPDPTAGPAPEAPSALLAELLLIRVANENPAAGPLHELIDDRTVTADAAWPGALATLEAALAREPGTDDLGSPSAGLLAILRAPAAHAPTSLTGQLRYVRDHWVRILGPLAAGLLGALDAALGELAEEEASLGRFGGPGGPRPAPQPPSVAGLAGEVEAFSRDADWMPGLVLGARSTYVWLDQLSRRHGRPITTLDAIPDEELERLARWGISGLWLIGVWQRSRASQEIKRRRGSPDALASAYALDDYRIAEELGGEDALVRLRGRALGYGIRLACDMVPNHMGIDSGWLIEHPEWFLSLPEPPYPAYTYGGPDLSADERVEIVLEDHYWDGSDAAVVFLRRERGSGETRFVYHGNDGTSLPWNDTAQLDFLRADVREQVIRTIVGVAHRFPVIRFDAAMVLARQHIERLWWPQPGEPGGVPSRAAHALTKAEFDRLMPTEFWRDVVDRVAAEAPDTLLLAEAFWLLEGYFVRTLGMHRVYNSAFMHMLRDEDIAGYRRLIRETVAFDPEILERYVNFMTNPDEATAIGQFGREEKAFGVATVLATMPGLPMLGHGQVEGFSEKYGMEFRRAQLDEQPDAWLVDRHEREIAPLLRERRRFARAGDFRLYDLVRDDGTVDEGVLAYSNGRDEARSLVVYHGRFASTTGRLRDSVAFAEKGSDGSRTLRHETLADALELPAAGAAAEGFVAFRDRRLGLEHVRPIADLRASGLRVALGAYDHHVFDGFRVVGAGADRTQWAALAARLGEDGVPSLDDAIRDLALAPLHDRLVALLAGGPLGTIADAMAPDSSLSPADLGPSLAECEAWDRDLHAAARELGVPDQTSGHDPRAARDRLAGSAVAAGRVHAALAALASPGGPLGIERLGAPVRPLRVAGPLARPKIRLEVAVALLLGGGSLDPQLGTLAASRFDACRLAAPLVRGFRGVGVDEAEAERATTRIRALLAMSRPDWSGTASQIAARIAAAWLAEPAVRSAAGVNAWQGHEWVVREAWEALVHDAVALMALDASTPAGVEAAAALAADLEALADAAAYRVDALAGA